MNRRNFLGWIGNFLPFQKGGIVPKTEKYILTLPSDVTAKELSKARAKLAIITEIDKRRLNE